MKTSKIIFLLILSTQISFAEEQSKKLSRKERRELKRKERAAKKESNTEDFSEKAQVWVKETWSKVKTSLFGSGENVKKKWNKIHKHHKKSGSHQRRAKQAEHEINKHHATSKGLLQDLNELTDPVEKKHIQKYHRQSKRGKKEAEDARMDLEYALKQVAAEAERIQQVNDENLQRIKECRTLLVDYQNEIDLSLKNQEKQERKKQRKAERKKRKEAKKEKNKEVDRESDVTSSRYKN